jgi:CubicO group peptidase (beta-lactamase class C family)
MENTSWFLADFDTNTVARPHRFAGGNYHPYPHYGFADYPNGLLRSTVVDMANFLIAYLQGGLLNSNMILSNTSVSEMLTFQVPSLDPTQGIGWYEEILYPVGPDYPVWGHNGGEDGVSTDIYIDPSSGTGIAAFANGEGTNLYICDELLNYGLSLSGSGVGNPICDAVTAIENTETLETNFLFPNPIATVGTLSFPNSNHLPHTLEVFDINGKRVLKKDGIRISQITISVETWNEGLYLYKLSSSGEIVATDRFVVN